MSSKTVTSQSDIDNDIPRLLVPLPAVAESLSVSKHTIRAFIRQGRLRPVRICRRLLFDPSEIARFVSEAK